MQTPFRILIMNEAIHVMTSTENPLTHLLWCILVALRTASKTEAFRSETARRKFIASWLDNARLMPSFRGMGDDFATLRSLLEKDREIPIEGTLNTLLMFSSRADDCDLFRFRMAISSLLKKGWRTGICRWPEEIMTEILQRREGRRNHLLQLTATTDAFLPTGVMCRPVTFQLLMHQTRGNNDRVEEAFYDARFIVISGREDQLDRSTWIRTLHVGTNALPENEWDPDHRDIWKPDSYRRSA
ncbi:Protein of uncharacterised function (DUF2913) [Citrobacter koseri]|nr:Protein of uncharacterised function (DUF2913) [Citrobacter koseri]